MSGKKEKLDEIERIESERIDREEREEVIKKGIEKGSEQTTIKTIKQMLKKEWMKN